MHIFKKMINFVVFFGVMGAVQGMARLPVTLKNETSRAFMVIITENCSEKQLFGGTFSLRPLHVGPKGTAQVEICAAWLPVTVRFISFGSPSKRCEKILSRENFDNASGIKVAEEGNGNLNIEVVT